MRVGWMTRQKERKNTMETNYENNENRENVENTGACAKDFFGMLGDLLRKLCRTRVQIRKDGQVRKDIPLLACGILAMISLKFTIAIAVIGLLLGYTADLKCD